MRIKGFTLIELLVVISIIGILASLVLASYSGAQKQTRDTQRKSDLSQYRNALESYAAVNDGKYPARNGVKADLILCNNELAPFLSNCPKDPIASGDYNYYYYSGESGGGASATKYVLWVQLETGGYWEICSDGRAGKFDGRGKADANCDLP